MAVLREAKYIKSDVRKNNNKFWYIYENDDATVTTHWGRVGDTGQQKTKDFSSQSAATSFFDKKCHEKERAGRNGEIAYRPLNVVGDGGAVATKSAAKTIQSTKLKDIATKQIRTNNPTVTKLITYLTKVNAHNITSATGGQITYNDTTGLFSTPLGIVTQENIDDANDILVEIGDMVANGSYGVKLTNRTNDYLMLVPQDIGRRKLDVNTFWASVADVQKQKAIVDSLEASLVSAIKKPTKSKKADKPEEKVFDVQLFLVEDDAVIKKLHKKFYSSKKDNHSCRHLKPGKIWSVEIASEKAAWEKDGAKMQNIWSLFHGSATSNLISILKQGLIIPPASSSHCTGRLYGNGIYASKTSTKALNYSYGYWGGKTDSRCFMFVLDMAMGKYYTPSRSNYTSIRYPQKGFDSTFAEPRKSGVYNDECIVYRTSQVHLRYLMEFV